MNWKMWTWPGQIRTLEVELKYQTASAEKWYERANEAAAASRELVEIKARQKVPLPPHELQLLQNRVAGLAADDPLWPRLLALVKNNVERETDTLCAPAIGDGEAHRARGRVGMLLDLEAQLNQVWQETHQGK